MVVRRHQRLFSILLGIIYSTLTFVLSAVFALVFGLKYTNAGWFGTLLPSICLGAAAGMIAGITILIADRYTHRFQYCLGNNPSRKLLSNLLFWTVFASSMLVGPAVCGLGLGFGWQFVSNYGWPALLLSSILLGSSFGVISLVAMSVVSVCTNDYQPCMDVEDDEENVAINDFAHTSVSASVLNNSLDRIHGSPLNVRRANSLAPQPSIPPTPHPAELKL